MIYKRSILPALHTSWTSDGTIHAQLRARNLADQKGTGLLTLASPSTLPRLTLPQDVSFDAPF